MPLPLNTMANWIGDMFILRALAGTHDSVVFKVDIYLYIYIYIYIFPIMWLLTNGVLTWMYHRATPAKAPVNKSRLDFKLANQQRPKRYM